MQTWMYVLIAVPVLFLAFYVLLDRRYKRTYQKLEQENHFLNKRISDLQDKLRTIERRTDFRIDIANTDCRITLLESREGVPPEHQNQEFTASILNVSRSGMAVSTAKDLSVRDRWRIQLKFELLEHPFELRGDLIRKEEYYDKATYIYAIRFAQVSVDDERELVRVLNTLSVQQGKNAPYDNRY